MLNRHARRSRAPSATQFVAANNWPLRHPRETVLAPTFAADAMVDDEKAVRIVAVFDVGKTRNVRPQKAFCQSGWK
jgi:hypothetical protein